jgi:argininosuccinate lyase
MTKTTVQVSEDEIKRRAAQESFPAATYSANVLTDVFEDAKRLFLDYMLEVDYAHALMLAEQGIITPDEAHSIFAALDGLDRDNLRASHYDGTCEDLFF